MRRLFLLAALALAFCAQIAAANAGPQVVLCQSARGMANTSTGTINLPNLSQSYALDTQGCVVANGFADIGVFRANGFSEPGKERSIVFATGVASGATSFLVGQIPAG